MSIPGVGAITAAAFVTTVDDPARFPNSKTVGAYFGLTPRRYQSGEQDRNGHISKCGDSLVRKYLFEAATALLTRVQKWSALKAWHPRIGKYGKGLPEIAFASGSLTYSWVGLGRTWNFAGKKIYAVRGLPGEVGQGIEAPLPYPLQSDGARCSELRT